MERNNNDFDFEEESSFDYKEWGLKILRHWYVILIAIVIAGALAYLSNRKWKPLYQVQAQVILGGKATQGSSYAFMQGFNSDAFNNNNDQLILFGRDELIIRTIEKLPLQIEYFSQGRFKRNYFYKDLSPITLTTFDVKPQAFGIDFLFQEQKDSTFILSVEDSDGNTIFSTQAKIGEIFTTNYFSGIIQKNTSYIVERLFIRFRSRESLQEEFTSRLSFSLLEGTSVASVSLIGEQAERDKDFINGICEEFLIDNLERKNEEANRTIDFIDSQLILMSDSLASSNEKIHKFRKTNQIVNLDSYMSGLLSQSSDFKSKDIELNLKEAYFNYLDSYLRKNAENEQILAPSTLGISDPVLLDLVNKINDLQLKRATIGTQNPFYEKYTQELNTLKATLFEVLKNIRNIYQMDRSNIEKQYADVLKEIESLSEKESEILDVERQHQINNNYYTYLLQKRSEAQIRKASNISDITILQKAKVISLVNQNVKKNTYIKFLAIGIIIAILLIVLKELLNNTVKSTNELEKATKFSVLGTIPFLSMSEKILTIHYLKSSFTEYFRIIKTRVEFITQKKDFITICTTSPESGDGKSYFSINLAGIYSHSGKNTLLIDMDLRKPSIEKNLNIKSGKGVSNILIGDCTIEEAIISNRDEYKFDILPAGTIPPNPGELLASEHATQLLDTLKKKYEYIIIDTSPIGLVSDAYPITRLSDIVLFISLYGKTDKTNLKNIANLLQKDKIPNIYAILNGVKENRHQYGYKQNNHYYHTSDYFENDHNVSHKKRK